MNIFFQPNVYTVTRATLSRITQLLLAATADIIARPNVPNPFLYNLDSRKHSLDVLFISRTHALIANITQMQFDSR